VKPDPQKDGALPYTEICRDGGSLRRFLERHFDGRPGLVEEFPLLVGEGNRERRIVARTRDTIVAHSAWRPLVLRSGEERIRAAGIGLVTTHREWRGRGLATRLVGQCLARAYAERAEVALLFAEERELYRRLGFVPVGRERVTRPRPASAGGEPTIRAGGPADARALEPLLAAHPLRVERSVEEFRALLGVPGVRLALLEEGGRPVAYCVEGKGRDLRGVVHEWAGEPKRVGALLAHAAARDDAPACVLSPDALPPPVEGEHRVGAFAQLRILRPERFASEDPREVFGDPTIPPRLPIYLWGLDSV
jgi:predicted N-acetyltransferase YhbS